MSVEPQSPYRNPLLPIEQRVADLLSRVTLEEKITQGSTTFPQAIALASTWNPDLVRAVFTAAAGETRAAAIMR